VDRWKSREAQTLLGSIRTAKVTGTEWIVTEGRETMEPDNNLLVELHRWAWRQDENFTTDAFAHLLRHLLAEEPAEGVALLKRLVGGATEIPLSEADSVAIRTQKPTEKRGIPDLRITGPGFLVLIEVRVGADVNLDQFTEFCVI